LLERGRNFVWISSDVEPHCFQNSCNHIPNVSSHNVTARVRDSLAPLTNISRSKPSPVLLENAYAGFTLIDLFSFTKSQCVSIGLHTAILERLNLRKVSIWLIFEETFDEA